MSEVIDRYRLPTTCGCIVEVTYTQLEGSLQEIRMRIPKKCGAHPGCGTSAKVRSVMSRLAEHLGVKPIDRSVS